MLRIRSSLLAKAAMVQPEVLSLRRVQQHVRWHGDEHVPEESKTIPIVFVRRNGEKKQAMAAPGQNLLRVAQQNDIELEGACECSVACSTCHVVLDPEVYASLPEASEDEEDMLDMAFGLTSTSRLGCQVKVDESMKGTVVTLPKATRNFYVDGHQPKPH